MIVRLKNALYVNLSMWTHQLIWFTHPVPPPSQKVFSKAHGAVISFIMAYSSYFHLGSDEIIGNQTPFFFDASAKDLYLMMYTGAALEVLPSENVYFPCYSDRVHE